MILVTTDEIPGRRVTRVLGLVQGSSVRARHIGQDITAFLKNLRRDPPVHQAARGSARTVPGPHARGSGRSGRQRHHRRSLLVDRYLGGRIRIARLRHGGCDRGMTSRSLHDWLPGRAACYISPHEVWSMEGNAVSRGAFQSRRRRDVRRHPADHVGAGSAPR